MGGGWDGISRLLFLYHWVLEWIVGLGRVGNKTENVNIGSRTCRTIFMMQCLRMGLDASNAME